MTVSIMGPARGSGLPLGPQSGSPDPRLDAPVRPGATPGREPQLLAASRQLEGVFVQHLMKALRSTVPDGGHPDAPGADLYGALLDEHLSAVVAGDTKSGIAEAIYRQLTSGPVDPGLGGSDS